MALPNDFTEVIAVPGQPSIIDAIHPNTGRTCINGETLEQVRERYPNAVRMTWETFRIEQMARQDTPITWEPTTAEQYNEMLNVLPPAAWIGDAFLVGEPCDHSFATGAPRFQAYRQTGDLFYVASRPMTRAEFRAALR